MRVFTSLTASEFRLLRREPAQLFWILAFPSLLVIILGSVPAFREPSADLGGLRVIDLYVTIALIMTLASLGLQVSPLVLATYRERGILRRLSTTPARPAALLGAQLTTGLLTALGSLVLVLTIARLAFAVALPRNLPAFVVAYLLTAGAAFAIGLFVAAVAPAGKVANTIGTLTFFPLMFFAGLWTPREVFPEVLRRIADVTPLAAGERAVQAATSGQWPAWGSLTVLGAYMLVFGLAAARMFRWE